MKKRRILSIIVAALIASSVLVACSGADNKDSGSIQSDTSQTQSEKTDKNGQDNTATNDIASENSGSDINSVITSDEITSSELFTERDLSGDYEKDGAVTVKGSGTSFTVSGNGAKADGNVLTITQEGTYILSGNVTDGRIVVEADDTAKVHIVLDGFTLTSSDYSAFYAKSASKVFITLAKGTENKLSDGSAYKTNSDESSVDSAIFSKCDLTINGTGTLTVEGNMSHAIVSKDDLKVASGTINATSAGSAICGKDSVRIADGTISITSGGDGIKSTNDEDAEKGFIYIGGGKITINSVTDGIQAETTFLAENADINIKSGGGSENSSKTHADNFGGWGNWNNSTAASSEDSTSAKGIKAGGNIDIKSGTITIDSADDSVHSNSNTTITDGTISVTSGDDGIHANTSLTIDGGKVTVKKSYEGLESSAVIINGGEIDVTASDDGINCGGGSDSSSVGGRIGQNSFTANSDVYLKITDGNVKVNAGGDGLDSNNTITIEGGTIFVDGPTDNGNAAIDYEVSATISGGTLVAVGTSGMAVCFSEDSTQASILYAFSTNHSAGEKITLTSSTGEEILSYTSAKNFNAVNLSSAKIQSGETYTLTAGSESVSIELTSNTYSNVTGGMGGMGGGMPGGGIPDGGMPSGQKPGGMPGGMHVGMS